jgi:hypothetical protein
MKKNKPKHNTDGLINWLRQPGLLQGQPLKSMREKFLMSIEFTAPRLFRLLGQSLCRAAGLRAGATFFARYLDYFVMTRKFTAVYLDLIPFTSITVTRNFLHFTGTGKKCVTATRTPTNQTVGPLAQIALRINELATRRDL